MARASDANHISLQTCGGASGRCFGPPMSTLDGVLTFLGERRR